MARPRKITPDIMVLKMAEVISKILTMNDTEIGAWFRKAAVDVMNGCKDQDCDPLIRQQFEHALQELQKRQEHNATMYRNRLARQGKVRGSAKTQGESNTGSTVPAVCPESGDSLVTTTKPCPDKHKTTATEATTPRAGGSCSTIIPEDGGTREDPLDVTRTGSPRGVSTAGVALESAKSSGNLSLAGATPMSCGLKENVPVSLSGTAPASTATVKKPYGTCGHVMLTDAEGHHLREVYGKNLATAIDILDAYIENNGKASKKYKNHAAVLRKGNWVWNKVQEMILNEKRIENANRSGKSFKQQERERETELMHSSIFAPTITIDEDTKRIANG